MVSKAWDTLWENIHLATFAGGQAYGMVQDAALAVRAGRIAWLGPRTELPARHPVTRRIDGQGHWMTPGLVDCHTHLIYGGNRAREFEMRLQGHSYADIARAGGGIISSVQATRQASEEELLASALVRLDRFRQEGVTSFEIKSGYGLSLAAERTMLRTARRIAQVRPVRVCTTFLGAHALPPEFAGRSSDYVDYLCAEMLPSLAAEGLVDAVDAFCEHIGFSPQQVRQLFERAQQLGLPVKLHAEQLSDQGGAALAAGFGALSCDHLEHLSLEGIHAMAKAGTVAVLLPGAYYYLNETRLPPIAALRGAGVPMAVASDHNPGTSPVQSLLAIVNMACVLFRLTPEEALAGVTREAARALGLQGQLGTLEVGKIADLALWAVDSPGDLCYSLGANTCRQVVVGGLPVAA